MLKNFITDFFYNSHLDFLNEKDIIWAKRYDTEALKEKIEEGHRIGPYVVIHKKGKKVYALECTSNKNFHTNQLMKLEYNRKFGYNLTKDGYIFVGKLVLLNKERFLEKIGKLDDEDLNRIYKSMYLIKKRYRKNELRRFPNRKLKFYYEIGDIIIFNNVLYYITNIDDNFYYVNQVQRSKRHKNRIIINNISYSINFCGSKKISKNCKIELSNITDVDLKMHIQNFLDRKSNLKGNSKTVNGGNLILMDNTHYYIYGEFQNKLLLYKIYLDCKANLNMYKIKIKNGIYYTLFEESSIGKKENIKILRSATVLEVEEIKKLKKQVSKNNKKIESHRQIIYKKYQPGFIIVECETLDRYIIIKRYENTIIYSSLDDIKTVYKYVFSEKETFNFEIYERMDRFKFKMILDKYNFNKEKSDEQNTKE